MLANEQLKDTTLRHRQQARFPILPPMPFIPQNMPGWAEENAVYRLRSDINDIHGYLDSLLVKSGILSEYYRFIHGMYAFVCWDWVRPLAHWIGNRRCMEVLAGRGFLSYALRECGVQLVSTDDYSWHRGPHPWSGSLLLTEIEELDAVDSIRKYGTDIDILIMSWSYMDLTSYDVVRALREVNPDCLIVHIGEGPGGCTDSEEFFDAVEHADDKFFDKAVSRKFKAWLGLHDRLNLFRVQELTADVTDREDTKHIQSDAPDV